MNTNNTSSMELNDSENIDNPGDNNNSEPIESMAADSGTDYKNHAVSSSQGSGRPSMDNACSDGGDLLSYGDRVIEPPSPLTGCYLLIVLAAPQSEEHKSSILQHLLKGKSKFT